MSSDPQRQRNFFSFLLSRKVPPIPLEEERRYYPESTANIFSRIFFWWLLPILKTGYKRTLDYKDLYLLTEELSVDHAAEKFWGIYISNLTKRDLKNKNFSGIRDIWRFILPEDSICVVSLFQLYSVHITLSVSLVALSYTCTSLNTLLSRELIRYVENRGTEGSIGRGIGFSIGTALLSFLSGVLQNHGMHQGMMTGARCKALLTRTMVDKALRLSLKSQRIYPSGNIVSMIGADLSRIDKAFTFFPVAASFLVPLVISIVVLLVNIGVASLVSIALLFIFLFVLIFATSKMVTLRRSANKYTDKRLKLIQEVINNLKMIKLYSWEIPYYEQIARVRKSEMFITLKVQTILNTIMAISMSFGTVISTVAFLVLYGIKKNDRSPANIFSSLSLFNMLSQIVYMLPQAMNACGDAYVGLKRVDKFMQREEIESETTESETIESESSSEKRNKGYSLIIENAIFSYGTNDGCEENENNEDKTSSQQESKSKDLRINHLKIHEGSFIAVVGPTGSGKTSLLNAISGFMPCVSGTRQVHGSISYCCEPWIQNATVRENILFGREFHQRKYSDVITSCSLWKDFEEMEYSDFTEVGERGITLSGGQKARVSLARALYTGRDIFLLDDVLSAVDAKVGNDIMKNCFLNYLKDKTRIMATNHTNMLMYADTIIFINSNGTIDSGSVEYLIDKNKEFRDFMSLSTTEGYEKAGEGEEEESIEVEEKEEKEKEMAFSTNDARTKALSEYLGSKSMGENKLIQTENTSVNRLGIKVYSEYAKFGSGKLTLPGWCLLFFVSTIFATFSQLFVNVWLSFWVKQKFLISVGEYIGIYVMFTCLTVILLLLELLSLVYLSNTASLNLHIKGFKNILFTPMSFLDTTPVGRILNRFSRDTEVLDNEIGNFMRLFTFSFAQIIGIIILCIIYMPWFAIAVPILFVVFLVVVSFYQASSREIKRIESVQRSFVYSKFTEILNGMQTLKIYDREDFFCNQLNTSIDRTNEAYFISIANQRWLGVHITSIGSVFVLLIALLCVNSILNIDASSTGVVLSYVLQIVSSLVILVRSGTQFENNMNSAERLQEYAEKLPKEAPYILTEINVPPSWPNSGSIKFEDVSMRYRPGLPLVLKNVSLSVAHSEKVGVCGRTGAGKSSIISCLFRLSELANGRILIDGVDISTVGLHKLRSKMSIIPQDPMLFEGDIRRNLDPFATCDDITLIDALEKVGLISEKDASMMKNDIQVSSKFALNQEVKEGGQNFSLGEKQLISFARALVKESKVLILDEATSSVDYHADARIQNSLKNDFNHCTVICIAHRLKSIINYDKILVLENGYACEFDSPLNLYRKGGMFREMCEKSHISEIDFIEP
ncbi:Piso0_000598 [Millerozyma farinosa CBS 7064]|uniref:Piso0_000598 protein n=1 Tax=Pichia sorbitophila (strain ATCC MYA-4447 / BCRC 22081 / CBS 7064 / NBRC 10061 / NRRL Y-12695) TaxID=559304 RepID=G8YVV7_PICSO|nr:Piso0_000598 [Millerozyma farinosa CBS 7064]CCE73551.1 Piso0_000598 [Millerozyma farinosa CBS 7064]